MEVEKIPYSIYEQYTGFIRKFFELRSLDSHWLFFEEWLQLVVTDKFYTESNHPSELLFFYDQFVELYDHCQDLLADAIALEQVELEILNSKINTERIYSAVYLSHDEVENPLLVIHSIFKERDIEHYKLVLRDWLEASLSNCVHDDIGTSIFPLYSNSKKLIEAIWLILLKIEGKDFVMLESKMSLAFENTCPSLLKGNNLVDPYLYIEDFFCGSSLGSYRKDLKDWFKSVLHERYCVKDSAGTFYFYQQLIGLIHAGYLIIENNLVYIRTKPFCSNAASFGDWIDGVRAHREVKGFVSSYDLRTLNSRERIAPLNFLRKELKIEKIKSLRNGLQEWMSCALTKKSSIHEIDGDYGYKFYKKLKKIIEAFFLLVTHNPFLEDRVNKIEDL